MAQSLHINVLEYLASFIGIFLELQNNNIQHHRILCMTDNSSTLAWLHKSNFHPKSHLLHKSISRKLARTMISQNAALYSQHIAGKHNVVADAQSRDHHIDDSKLTYLLTSLFPNQAGANFRISSALPPELTCWIASLKADSTKRTESAKAPFKSKMGAFINGHDTWPTVKSTVSFWTNTAMEKRLVYSPGLLALFEEMSSDQQKKTNFQDSPLRPPLQAYARPLGRTFGQTLF